MRRAILMLLLALLPAGAGAQEDAFSRTLPGADLNTVEAGRIIFSADWAAAPSDLTVFEGLGPTYNRVGCTGCHHRNGRGRPPRAGDEPMISMLVRISRPHPNDASKSVPDPAYGTQIQDRGLLDVPAEAKPRLRFETIQGTYDDGTPYELRKPVLTVMDWAFGDPGPALQYSARVAPAIFGTGLLEAVPQATLESLADPNDADGDGVSGRVNHLRRMTDGRTIDGRFGWKANQTDLVTQNAVAFHQDIGITSRLFPSENCPIPQKACRNSYKKDRPELGGERLDHLTYYVRALAPPPRRNLDGPAVKRGADLFRSAGCAACHVPSLKTAPDASPAFLADRFAEAYTDLLLHDMGAGLADNRPDGGATGREWRTPPLWGLALTEQVNGHLYLLHDGRARGFAEAVLWHGGEAGHARDAFKAMPERDRAALIAFLKSL